MSIDNFGNVRDLEKQLNTAKQSLLILNENIKRFVGRTNKDIKNCKQRFPDQKKHDLEREPEMNKTLYKYKRESNGFKSVFDRLSSAKNTCIQEPKPRITSRVIREMPTREEIVEAQGVDSESRERNRRMFGSLLGTLQKFCQEESRLKNKEEKKAIIEKKLEEQELHQRETLKKERECLFIDRKRKQKEIQLIEIKMRRLKDFKTWESSTLLRKNFIQTKAKPHIYYKPRISSESMIHLYNVSKSEIDTTVAVRRDAVQQELINLEKINRNHEDVHLNDLVYSDNHDYYSKSLKVLNKQPKRILAYDAESDAVNLKIKNL